MIEDPQKNKCILLDWGDTLMRDFPQYDGPMFTWPRVKALPHVKETLAYLHPEWILAVATNAAASDETDIRKALANVDLDRWIDRIYCFQKIGYQKPSFEFFNFILEDLELPQERVLMVGDNLEGDVLGANRSGIRAVWFNERTGETHKADLIRTIHRFDEMPALLEDWGNHQK